MLCAIEREGRDVIWVDGVANEASCRVRVEAKHKKKCKVMGIPESFKALLTNLLM
jgi:hypothetical protein